MSEKSEPVVRRIAAVPTAAGVATRLAVAELNRRGTDPGPLLARVGLSAVTLDQGGRVDVRSQIEFLELASHAVGDDFLGLTLAEQFDLRELGMLYYVAASSHCLGDALRRLERYVRLANEALIATASQGLRVPPGTLLCQRAAAPRPAPDGVLRTDPRPSLPATCRPEDLSTRREFHSPPLGRSAPRAAPSGLRRVVRFQNGRPEVRSGVAGPAPRCRRTPS